MWRGHPPASAAVADVSPNRIESSDQRTSTAGRGSPTGWRRAVMTQATSAGTPSVVLMEE